jgi:nucleobase transporter 1/2
VGTGLSHLQFTNMNLTRNIFVVGFSIFLGLSVPQYFSEFAIRSDHGPVHTHALWVNFLSLFSYVDFSVGIYYIGIVSLCNFGNTLTCHVLCCDLCSSIIF